MKYVFYCVVLLKIVENWAICRLGCLIRTPSTTTTPSPRGPPTTKFTSTPGSPHHHLQYLLLPQLPLHLPRATPRLFLVIRSTSIRRYDSFVNVNIINDHIGKIETLSLTTFLSSVQNPSPGRSPPPRAGGGRGSECPHQPQLRQPPAALHPAAQTRPQLPGPSPVLLTRLPSSPRPPPAQGADLRQAGRSRAQNWPSKEKQFRGVYQKVCGKQQSVSEP